MEASRAAPPLRRPRLTAATHALAAAWIVGMLALGAARPGLYAAALQEDRFIEWWTVTLFAAAGVLALRLAWKERRVFDGLVGAFCIFVAGEEFSWGQRLLGLTPPDAFLEHNRQQELTIHNFADVFGEPKWVLIMALAGFGLVIPALAATAAGRRLLARAGATAVRVPAAVWLLVAVVLLWWYPLTLTGEWVEALAGGIFLATFAATPRGAALAAAGGALAAIALTFLSGAPAGTEAERACARAETAALLDDLVYGTAATERLARARSVHKRVFTSIEDGYVRREGMESYGAVVCEGVADDGRREFALDPWGSAYWLSTERAADTVRIVVYSFGPDRRRGGDDIAAALDFLP